MGESGRGKSRFISQLAKRLIWRGEDLYWVNSVQFHWSAQHQFSDANGKAAASWLHTYRKAGVPVFDDIGSLEGTGAVSEALCALRASRLPHDPRADYPVEFERDHRRDAAGEEDHRAGSKADPVPPRRIFQDHRNLIMNHQLSFPFGCKVLIECGSGMNHHLRRKRSGLWQVRFTVDRGPKYVGRRVVIGLCGVLPKN